MGLFNKKPKDNSVYGQLKNQAPSESTRYRDVYETQQIKRSKIGTAGSMTARKVFVIICAVCMFIAAWGLMSGVQWIGAQLNSTGPASYVAKMQTDMNARYQEALKAARESPSDLSDADSIDSDSNGEEIDEADGVSTEPLNGILSVQNDASSLMYASDINGDGVSETVYYGADRLQGTADDYYEEDVNHDGQMEQVLAGEDLLFFTEDDYHSYCIGDIYRDITAGSDGMFGTEDDVVVLMRNDKVPSVGYYVGIGGFTFLKVLIAVASAAIVYAVMMAYMKKNWEAQNVMYDVSDINQWENDQHIQVPEEIQENYDWFPDVGAHAPVQVSSLISHMALTNKGLKSIQMTRRADKDIKDSDGQIVYYEGEALVDDDGNELTSKKPMIDEKFMDALWDASELPPDKTIRRKFDPSKIPYNPGNKNRDKLKDAETVADMINKYWTFPSYEPQRPGGAYIVDTQPVNTMVWLALFIRRNV